MTPEQIVDLLPGLGIEEAEGWHMEDPFASPDDPRRHRGSTANVDLFRAWKPRCPQV
jgi:hypothetical protein